VEQQHQGEVQLQQQQQLLQQPQSALMLLTVAGWMRGCFLLGRLACLLARRLTLHQLSDIGSLTAGGFDD